MSVYQGVVRGNVVILPKNVRLADGLIVEVRTPEPEKLHSSENAFKQRLIETGLLLELRTVAASSTRSNRTPIMVKGKPLSEILIEERR